jgi:lysophospholipase L1-like esterase
MRKLLLLAAVALLISAPAWAGSSLPPAPVQSAGAGLVLTGTALGLPSVNTSGAGAFSNITVDALGRITAVRTLNGTDITGALGFTPYNATNPAGYVPIGTTTGTARDAGAAISAETANANAAAAAANTANAAIPNTQLAFPSVASILDMPNQPVVTANNICELGDSIISYGGFGPNRNDPSQVFTSYGFRQEGIQTQIGRLTGIFPSLAGNQGWAGDTTQAAGSDPGIHNRLVTLLAAQNAPCYHAAFFVDEGGTNDISSNVSGVNPQLTPAVTIANREADIALEIANGSTVFALPIMPRNVWGTVASPFTLSQWQTAELYRHQINMALQAYCALYTKCRWIPLDGVLSADNTVTVSATANSSGTLTISGGNGAANLYRGWTVIIPPSSGTTLGTNNIVTASTATAITLASSTPVPASFPTSIQLCQCGASSIGLENNADGLHPNGAGAEAIAGQIVALNPGFFPARDPGELSGLSNYYNSTNNPFGTMMLNGNMLGVNGTVISGATGVVPSSWTGQNNTVTSTGTDVLSVPCPAPGLNTNGCAYTQTISRTSAGGSAEQFDPTAVITNNLPAGTEMYARCMGNVTSGTAISTGAVYTATLEVTYDSGGLASDGSTQFSGQPQMVTALGNWRYYQTPVFTTTTTNTIHLVWQIVMNNTGATSGSPYTQVSAIANCGLYPVASGTLSMNLWNEAQRYAANDVAPWVALPWKAVGTSTTNAANVYPATGAKVNALGTNAAFSVPAASSVTFRAISAAAWFT